MNKDVETLFNSHEIVTRLPFDRDAIEAVGLAPTRARSWELFGYCGMVFEHQRALVSRIADGLQASIRYRGLGAIGNGCAFAKLFDLYRGNEGTPQMKITSDTNEGHIRQRGAHV